MRQNITKAEEKKKFVWNSVTKKVSQVLILQMHIIGSNLRHWQIQINQSSITLDIILGNTANNTCYI